MDKWVSGRVWCSCRACNPRGKRETPRENEQYKIGGRESTVRSSDCLGTSIPEKK